MFYHTMFWIPAATLVTLAIICGLLFGDAVLMGWAHNWGLILLFSLLVSGRHAWPNLSTTDKRLTYALIIGSLFIFWGWTTMESPWIFSTYVYLSLSTGWMGYLVGKGQTVPVSYMIKPAQWLAIGTLPILFIPLYTTALMDTLHTQQPELWVYKMLGFGNIRAIGHFVAIGALAATAWAWHSGKKGWWWWPLIALLWMVGFWSGSRTGLVAGLFALIGAALICRVTFKHLSMGLAAFAVGAALSLPWPMPTHHFGAIDRLAKAQTAISQGVQTSPQSAVSGLNTASSGRVDLWTRGIDSIQENSLYGKGLGNWQKDPFNNPERPFFHLHNIVLDTLHSFGIFIGGAMLAMLALSGLMSLIVCYKIGKAATFPAMMVLVSAGLSVFDATLWMPFPAGLAGLSIGMLLLKKKEMAAS